MQKNKVNKRNYLKQSHAHEFVKCFLDPIYFLKNYVKINHPNRGVIDFELYPYQEEMISNFHNHKNVICLTARQMGKCVTGNTWIKKNKKEVNISELIKLSFWDKIILYLENKLLENLLQKENIN